MTNIPRPRAKKLEAIEHLHYEIQMLVKTASRLSEMPEDEKSIERNAFTESFAIHARVLWEFLFKKERYRHPTDVRPKDFDPDWPKTASKDQELEDAITRSNTEIAHLSYERITSELQKKPLPHLQIAHDLLDVLKLFVELAQKKFDNEAFSPLMDTIKNHSLPVVIGTAGTASTSTCFIRLMPPVARN
jgi:hypothetical protein